MGIALVSSLKQQGITDTAVPVSSLVVFLVPPCSGCSGCSPPRGPLAGPPGWTCSPPSPPSYAHTRAARTRLRG